VLTQVSPSPTESQSGCGQAEGRAIELTILMPCLNEARTVGACVEKARGFLAAHAITGEVIVADNGSQDGSCAVAERCGARVVHVFQRGYGAALAGGIAAARGRFVIMGDSDGSYDWAGVGPFLERLRAGAELVMGNRFQGRIERGAMPFLHRYVGNPFLTAVGRRFFGSHCGDFYCGQRGFSRAAVLRMGLRSIGMEFALEMLVRATLLGMKVTEVPITLSPDGRGRRSHLRTWRDGWRSLRFFLLYSPRWLFLYPGLLLMLLGSGLGLLLVPGPRVLAGMRADVHALLYCAVGTSVGFQLAVFCFFGKMLALLSGLHPPSRPTERAVRSLHLEHGLLLGGLLVLAGLLGSVAAIRGWARPSSGELDPFAMMRIAIPSALLLTLGCQVVCWSFFFSMLKMQWQERFGHEERPHEGKAEEEPAQDWKRRKAA
jgi:glycosyltransferase involved in cell wall biosynthesis